MLYSFVLDKKPGYKVLSEPETIQYRTFFKSVLNTIKFYLAIDNHEEVNFNGETLTFTLQMIKTQYNMFTIIFMSNYTIL